MRCHDIICEGFGTKLSRVRTNCHSNCFQNESSPKKVLGVEKYTVGFENGYVIICRFLLGNLRDNSCETSWKPVVKLLTTAASLFVRNFLETGSKHWTTAASLYLWVAGSHCGLESQINKDTIYAARRVIAALTAFLSRIRFLGLPLAISRRSASMEKRFALHRVVSLPVPPWFGPEAVLEEVERLVVNDNDNASVGWTWEQIKVPLLRTHQQQEEELPQDFDAVLDAVLARLCEMRHLKVGAGGQQRYYEYDHYTLSDIPPYLPPWFGTEAVLQAVRELDDAAGGGSTWEEIRDSLMRTHQPGQPLPPDLDTVLETMLSVLREKGHLTWGARSSRHYTRRRAPALVEADPIRIPNHLWFYYLGYYLGARIAFIDFSSYKDEDNRNAPPWFSPRTVLEEVEQLVVKYNDHARRGWTLEQIKSSLLQTHQQQDEPPPPPQAQGFDLDAALRTMLSRLCRRGHLETTAGDIFWRCYTLPITLPCIPPWFGPEAILQAIGELDKEKLSGSTWQDIIVYLRRIHGDTHPPMFHELLQTTLSVLRQRGHLTRGHDPQDYTRPHAPATTIDIPPYPDHLFCYDVGYKLGRDYRLLKNPELAPLPLTAKAVGMSSDVGLRQRRGRKISANNPRNDGMIIEEAEQVGSICISHPSRVD